MKKIIATTSAIILVAILVSLVGIVIFQNLANECGDDICELSDLKTCGQDCKPTCSYGYYSGLIGKNMSKEKVQELVREECSPLWDDIYTESRVSLGISDDYVSRTREFNFDNWEVQKVLPEFKGKYTKAETITRAVGDWVYFNVEYHGYLDFNDCFRNRASDIIRRGYGLCSTMTKVNIALLRGMGIASRPVLGCVHSAEFYSSVPLSYQERPLLQKLVDQPIFRKPNVPAIELDPEVEGIVTSRGGLHTWLEVWLPEKGWVILEPTTGYLIDPKSTDYLVYKREPNDADFCGLDNQLHSSFLQKCRAF
ncbi:MAG: transglutaminase family protein [Nanoarchaeota archaeon]|nr:transglutaminase family protein [Nanoarchaeota archaeon]